jgi:hypothetical protein
MREPRNLVMTLVEASWEDQNGTLHTVPARMEDRSVSGACIRIKSRIVVGSKLRIQSHWEQFSGAAKYCRSEGKEYLVGIQRDRAGSPMPPVPTDVPQQESVRSSDLLFSRAEIESLPKEQEYKPNEILVPRQEIESVPIALLASNAPAMPTRRVGHEMDNNKPGISGSQGFDAVRATEAQTKQPPNGKKAGNERKPMQRKWLELAGWRDKQDGLSGSSNGNNSGKSEGWNRAPEASPRKAKTPADPASEGAASFPGELLPVEDIYRAAGIMNPRRGYSIGKVVEMLHSEHLRGLSKEMRRAAVLMALEAAGIPLDQVHQDAITRQDALNSYEAEQRRQLEAGCARKAEENVQIQAEMERVKAHYMARISRNEDGVEREKATFGGWLTMKQQEAQSISEAAELCLKSTVSERDRDSLPEVSMVAVSARPV